MTNQPLIILDINGTLALSQHQRVPGVTPDARARTKFLYFRPGMRQFIENLFLAGFRVAVWSSNSDENVMSAVSHIFLPSQRERLDFIWGRSQCETNPLDYSSTKPLSKVFAANYKPHLVTIVDDTPEKITNTPSNYCYIEPYTKPTQSDCELARVFKQLKSFYFHHSPECR